MWDSFVIIYLPIFEIVVGGDTDHGGRVQQIYTHPINKKGEIRDGIIKSSQIRVVPNKKKK